MTRKSQERIEQSIGASVFFEAKIKEFEAACWYGDDGRAAKAEEDCRSALQGMLDSKRHQIKQSIEDARRNNR